jgi:hypothetical protein
MPYGIGVNRLRSCVTRAPENREVRLAADRIGSGSTRKSTQEWSPDSESNYDKPHGIWHVSTCAFDAKSCAAVPAITTTTE